LLGGGDEAVIYISTHEPHLLPAEAVAESSGYKMNEEGGGGARC